MSCPLISVTGLPWCPVIWGDYILRVQATICNINRVVDQVCALKCTVVGSNPPMRPVHYQEVCSRPLKFACDFIFDHFLRFFPFDSLGAVPENTGTVICGVRLSVGPIYRDTTVWIWERGRQQLISHRFIGWHGQGVLQLLMARRRITLQRKISGCGHPWLQSTPFDAATNP